MTPGPSLAMAEREDRHAARHGIRANPRRADGPVDDFGDTSVRLAVRPWCEPEHYFALRYELPERLKRAVKEAGGAMPTPQREIRLQQSPAP